MRVVRDPAELAEAIAGARREARSAFGDDTLLVERYIEQPRHIEVQVFGDTHGTVVHLGERECSPAAPAPEGHRGGAVPAAGRRRAARAMGARRGRGRPGRSATSAPAPSSSSSTPTTGDFYFLEMNTRLQVEHPVTELVTGLDLVELQLRVAAGEPLPIDQDDVTLDGHAIEARVYAEDPARGFLPQAGDVVGLVRADRPRRAGGQLAAGGRRGRHRLRPDAGQGHRLGSGPGDRPGPAGHRAGRAPPCSAWPPTPPSCATLLNDPDVVAGRLDTGLIERRGDALTHAEPAPPHVYAAAALALLLEAEPAGADVDPWQDTSGWRLGEPAWTRPPAAGARRGAGDGAGARPVLGGGGPGRRTASRWPPGSAGTASCSA